MSKPKLSILVCIDTSREAFWPWLTWNIRKQQRLDWSEVEVVITSWPRTTGLMRGDGPAIHFIGGEDGERVPSKRNRLMDKAEGRYLCWMDSDDWHSPVRLADACDVLDKHGEVDWVANVGAPYLNIETLPAKWCEVLTLRNAGVPITVVGRTQKLRSVRFHENITHGTDTVWLRHLDRQHQGKLLQRGAPYFFALYHGGNMSPHIGRFDYNRSWQELKQLCGDEWGETSVEISALYERLHPPGWEG